ncbi:hypothetical protein [Nocardia lasii]|uniref:PPE domain-containing protein n=1 Tax=Nocardia lasii TaxID=1616107 RepID=A0ABW1JWK0_9NOCA
MRSVPGGTDADYVAVVEVFDNLSHADIHRAVGALDPAALSAAAVTFLDTAVGLGDGIELAHGEIRAAIADGWRGAAAQQATDAVRDFEYAGRRIADVLTAVGVRLSRAGEAAESVRGAVAEPSAAQPDPGAALLDSEQAANNATITRDAENARLDAVQAMEVIYAGAFLPTGSGVPAFPSVETAPQTAVAGSALANAAAANGNPASGAPSGVTGSTAPAATVGATLPAGSSPLSLVGGTSSPASGHPTGGTNSASSALPNAGTAPASVTAAPGRPQSNTLGSAGNSAPATTTGGSSSPAVSPGIGSRPAAGRDRTAPPGSRPALPTDPGTDTSAAGPNPSTPATAADPHTNTLVAGTDPNTSTSTAGADQHPGGSASGTSVGGASTHGANSTTEAASDAQPHRDSAVSGSEAATGMGAGAVGGLMGGALAASESARSSNVSRPAPATPEPEDEDDEFLRYLEEEPTYLEPADEVNALIGRMEPTSPAVLGEWSERE